MDNQNSWKNKMKQFFSSPAHKKTEDDSKVIFGINVGIRVIRALIMIFIVFLLFCGAFGLGTGMGYFAYLVSDTEVPSKETLEKEINDVEQISTITYASGEAISAIKSDIIRTNVSSENISPYVKQAIVATEDEYYFEHTGIVPKAIIRATISDVLGVGGSSGGSTLTQQLVKQQVLTNESSYSRKANEILLAMRVDKYFSKEEILTSYLNVSPFGRNNKGQNIAGVEEAAKGIFGVSAKDLTLPQAAFIAGLPQSPITYSPYTNTGELKEDLSDGLTRKDFVLFSMYRNKDITKQQYEEAKNYDLKQDFIPQESLNDNQNNFLYNYLTAEAVEVLAVEQAKQDGKDYYTLEEGFKDQYLLLADRQLRRNGYTVQSTIDKDIYNGLQQSTTDYGYLIDGSIDKQVETGSILMENATGKILGFVGGRNFENSQNNHAFVSKRSPGSTAKPIIAYGPAIDVGLIGTESQLSNFTTNYKSAPSTQIKNAGSPGTQKFESVRKSLTMSYNIPVYHLYQELLKETDPAEYMHKMNFSSSDEAYYNEATPLGTYDVSVYEQTNAYATLANKGEYNKGYTIEKITDNAGNVIYEHQQDPVQVYSKETASIMNDMMRDVINSGTGTSAKQQLSLLDTNLASADWVGKTGTSEDDKDLWFVGSTPNVTLSIWIGYDDSTPLTGVDHNSHMSLWGYLANSAYQVNPELFGASQRFTLDSSIIKSTVSSFTGEKLGKVTDKNGTTITLTGKTLTSLYAKNGAPESKYEFGIGGTLANYQAVWSDYFKSSTETEKKKETEKKSEDNTTQQNNTEQPSSTSPSESQAAEKEEDEKKEED